MDGSLDGVQVRDSEKLERLQKRLAHRQLPARGEELQQLLAELDGALDDLQMILDPVLRPQGPSAVAGQESPEPASELAALLANLSYRLQRAVLFARDLGDRVDL
jgi:hypothetical protein